MIIRDFKPFVGQHCETTATGCLLNQIGLELSEPMLFGIGEALGYIFWNMKSMDFPFIGGRVKPDQLTENLCRNLNLSLEIKETASLKKAWANIETPISNGKVVGLKLDCFHLEYFSTKIHFAGHYVAMYGFDNDYAYLVDTEQQGGKVKTAITNLALARNEKGSMSSKNKSFTISKQAKSTDLNQAIKKAILNNANEYLNPPIKNLTYKGIKKTATEIKKWFNSTEHIKSDFQTCAMLMEKAGTGGALFRNLYRDFLKESFERLDMPELDQAHQAFKGISKSWTKIAALFHQVGETEDIRYIDEASEILLDLSAQEKRTMELLQTALGTS